MQNAQCHALFDLGIDFDKLKALRDRLARWLAGECLLGTIAQAGLPKKLRAPEVMA
ncbi:hypothetical protein [Limnohabitans planktonicus]|jgi:hydroxymethylglutaryl-CoA lyase|uniref:hypothetical protein n=1 Tax=Limnohabitans planktonicus TaxID=540060 RepID=UPI000AF91064|nr:hypothetical protein [Limnohabitans planktonicus]